MITPSFSTSQDDTFVYIRIRVPHIKISDVDVDVDGCTFKFYLKPYFLRLVLPGEVMEDDDAKAQYDVSTGEVLVQLSKVTKGEHFDGLDMLTTLLVKSKKNAMPVIGRSLIQVMDDGEEDNQADGDDNEEEEEEDDWEVEQELFDETAFEKLTLSGPKYGFANQSCGIFARFQGEALGVVGLPEPDQTPASQRHDLRIAAQNRKFDEEHYLADFVSGDDLKHLLDFTPHCNEQYVKYQEFLKSSADEAQAVDRSSTSDAAQSSPSPARDQSVAAQEKFVVFSSDELDKLKQLPNKEYLLDRALTRCTYLGLVDLMLAYAYNHRSTCGDSTVESSWTVTKISNLLSWFEWFPALKDVVVASTRNMLAYPLYRHWKLAKLVLKDVTAIFALGRRQILKCLLEIRSLLLDDENRYLLNDLYITDYCVWVQRCSQSKIKAIAERLAEMKLVKKDIGWHLSALEEAAGSVQRDHDEDELPSDASSATSSSSDESSSDDDDDDDDSSESASSPQSPSCDTLDIEDGTGAAASAAASTLPGSSAQATAATTTTTHGGLLDVGVMDATTSLTGHAYASAAAGANMHTLGQSAAASMETSTPQLLQPQQEKPPAAKKLLIEEL